MHPEIEKLIDLAIADGQITDKERNVLIKKAIELGSDPDEVEMVLDGRLHQLEATRITQNQSKKEGVIKKCHHCGATSKAFTDKCDSCGEDFRYNTLNFLVGKIQSNNTALYDISNTPIPINKEAIIDFLTFSIGNVKNKGLSVEVRWAWHAKMKEAFLKAESVFNNEEYKKFESKYDYEIKRAGWDLEEDTPKTEQQIKEQIKKQKDEYRALLLVMPITLAVIYFIFALIARLFGAHLWPF